MQSQNKKNSSLIISVLILIAILGCALAYYFNWQQVNVERNGEASTIFSHTDGAFFEPVLPDTPIVFPKDYQEHPEYQHEKWLMTVNAKNQNGDAIGIQWSMFRVSNDDRETKGWLDPSLYIAKVVITTKNGKWFAERLARGGIGQVGVSQRPYRVWIDDWEWRSLGRTPFPGRLAASSDDFSLKLSLNSNTFPVLMGEKGYLKKHDFLPIASYEYIEPFIAVRGSVTFDNQTYTITGQGLLEHEWASGFFDENQYGRDWFAINLDNQTKLIVTQYRYQDHPPYQFGALLRKNGSYTLLSEEDLTLQTLPARQLKNGRKVPLQWIINIPKYDINLTTQVMRNEQWLDAFIPYWQGPIITTGSHQASGFMQLAGY
ncbi:lipocalin-like domain-containing protein [Aliivibrio fischeri]|uniref:lipocalin-like domain-containing protein n=1 Tax=Aliivibrio fischeri TaxID=668 RepID=UPI0007C4B5C2|nr:lipocalin-like domain-containing protein [Aliivibrio fischeri]MBP3141437.1 carotenoid 1,2-hydratase [Aliivibrio fischeri]MBP3155266.1 carotenoid 1,2-hydratase [Aliivibrio fischeri]MBP3157943.1 carotenoid 1,2-hydratase [Aliivibrio fischeri]MCE7572421.1 carotenoid 1,2-hydratase [Aliivibrio fischeri]